MDPLTHCLVGAVAAQAFFNRRLGRMAPLIGAVAGGLADLDVLIRSADNPILAIVYHRHFTHALLFIPIGAMIAALPFLFMKRFQYRRPAVLGACLLAYALHAPLDACTTYGTLIFWPFSDKRIALDWISVIDPIFTLLLVAALVAGLVKLKPTFGRAGLAAAVLYICLGAAQHERAMNVQKHLADTRQHEMVRSRVMPTLGNLVVWRSIYEYNSQVHADAIRLVYTTPPTFARGQSARLYAEKVLPESLKDSRQARELDAYLWFADGWLAFVPERPGITSPLLDMRYSYTPEGTQGLWGVQLREDRKEQPLELVNPTPPREGLRIDLLHDIFTGESNGRTFTPLPPLPYDRE